MKKRPRKGRLRRGSKTVAMVVLLCFFLLLGTVLVFPRASETRVRGLLYRHFMVQPAVVAGWGSLLTRVLPIDDEHLIVGLSTSLVALRKQGPAFAVCAKLSDIGIIHDLAYENGTLYAAAGSINLAWYDLSDPCAPKKKGEHLFRGYGFGIEIQNRRLFLANREGGVTAFWLRADGTPVFTGPSYGDLSPFAGDRSEWMTNDVAVWGDGLVAADGDQGLVFFHADSKSGRHLSTYFASELTAPRATRNIDPPPLRLCAYRDRLYVAMREKGIAVFERGTDGAVKLAAWFRPDDGEVLDLTVDGSRLFVPSSRGKIFSYDLAADPIERASPTRVYDIGEEKIVLALAVRPPFSYAVATGAGLYRFDLDHTDPVESWRPPDEFRGVARVGHYYVVALGNGGLAVYDQRDGGWEKVAAVTLPSFVFEVTALADNLFAAAADLSGAYLYRLESNGEPRFLANIPTPEHTFAVAFSPPDRLATANGVYGAMLYRFDPLAAAPSPQAIPVRTPPNGYQMCVGAWRGRIIGSNFSGPLQILPEDGKWTLAEAPTRCLKTAVSPDGRQLALACRGNKVFLYSEPTLAPLKFTHSNDILSLLPLPDLLLIGGFPDRLSIFRRDDTSVHHLADFHFSGSPYKIIIDGSRYLVAAGSGGIYELIENEGRWNLRQIPLRQTAFGDGEAGW